VVIRRLTALDVEHYRSIRLAALKDAPQSFGSIFEVEAARPPEFFADRLASSVVLGAYAGSAIVGMVGFKQEAWLKVRHKGFVWGMYVQPEARGNGVGAALIEALFMSARDVVEQLTLSVVEGNDSAIGLYRKFGFEVYGLEPRALKTCAGYANELLMVRFLGNV
jgi:ribosomal protein S18 acetylase RimI-like enzyme